MTTTLENGDSKETDLSEKATKDQNVPDDHQYYITF
jgi:hypothetical protein